MRSSRDRHCPFNTARRCRVCCRSSRQPAAARIDPGDARRRRHWIRTPRRCHRSALRGSIHRSDDLPLRTPEPSQCPATSASARQPPRPCSPKPKRHADSPRRCPRNHTPRAVSAVPLTRPCWPKCRTAPPSESSPLPPIRAARIDHRSDDLRLARQSPPPLRPAPFNRRGVGRHSSTPARTKAASQSPSVRHCASLPAEDAAPATHDGVLAIRPIRPAPLLPPPPCPPKTARRLPVSSQSSRRSALRGWIRHSDHARLRTPPSHCRHFGQPSLRAARIEAFRSAPFQHRGPARRRRVPILSRCAPQSPRFRAVSSGGGPAPPHPPVANGAKVRRGATQRC